VYNLIPIAFKEVCCIKWDQYEKNRHTLPFINMEYAVPESEIEKAIDIVTDEFKIAREKNLYKRDMCWAIR